MTKTAQTEREGLGANPKAFSTTEGAKRLVREERATRKLTLIHLKKN